MIYSNFHTHTSFCDGKDSPEELVQQALKLGCKALGFSGHSYVPFDDCCMSLEATRAYKEEIRRLKEKYKGQIKILMGVEQDIFSPLGTEDYDYVIGSVHYILKNGEYLSVDESRERQLEIVRDYYSGDFYAFIQDYYSLVSQVYEKTHCDIIGHFDLVTKFNEAKQLFDTADPRYRSAALSALEKLIDSPAAFEVNTGAIARGYRSEPYPEKFILDRLKAAGKPLVISSDCHSKPQLLFGFSEYAQCLEP